MQIIGQLNLCSPLFGLKTFSERTRNFRQNRPPEIRRRSAAGLLRSPGDRNAVFVPQESRRSVVPQLSVRSPRSVGR